MQAGEEEVAYSERTPREMRAFWRKMNLPTVAEKNAESFWKTNGLGYFLTVTFLLCRRYDRF